MLKKLIVGIVLYHGAAGYAMEAEVDKDKNFNRIELFKRINALDEKVHRMNPEIMENEFNNRFSLLEEVSKTSDIPAFLEARLKIINGIECLVNNWSVSYEHYKRSKPDIDHRIKELKHTKTLLEAEKAKISAHEGGERVWNPDGD